MIARWNLEMVSKGFKKVVQVLWDNVQGSIRFFKITKILVADNVQANSVVQYAVFIYGNTNKVLLDGIVKMQKLIIRAFFFQMEVWQRFRYHG